MGASLLLLLLCGAPPGASPPSPAPPTAAAQSCAEDDIDCLRKEYNRLKHEQYVENCTRKRAGIGIPCDEELAAPKADEGFGIPWFGVAPLQWCATVGTDLLPACWFTFAAILLILPASTIPTIIITALGVAALPCLPCIQGAMTNAIGDALSKGSQRGKLIVQMLVGVAMLGVQLVAGLVGVAITGIFVNYLAVQQVIPQTRLLASACSPERRDAECGRQWLAVASSTGSAGAAVTVGAFAIVAANLAIAFLMKGPVLALAWHLHSDRRPAGYPAFLPRLARDDTGRDGDEEVKLVAARRR